MKNLSSSFDKIHHGKLAIIFLFLAFGAMVWFGGRRSEIRSQSVQRPEIRVQQQQATNLKSESKAEQPLPANPTADTQTSIPDSYQIKNVPFIVQAPFANWDKLHDEACEEASLLIVKHYLDGDKKVSPEKADEEILAMVDWQEKNWGGHRDLAIEETAKLAKDYWGKNSQIKYDITAEDIKKEIASGRPVIVPAAGRDLGNPNFRRPGPIYHMLVITGYNQKEFITNDPGTRNGKDFRYKTQTLYSAIHDWAGNPDNIRQGAKAMLIIY